MGVLTPSEGYHIFLLCAFVGAILGMFVGYGIMLWRV